MTTFRNYADAVQHGLAPRLYADLIGKPFADGGRGPDVYDCVGLAAEIQRRRGHAVPDFYSSEAELHRQIAGGGFLADCQRLREPEPGCVALFWMLPLHGVSHHLGTMVSRFRMVHTTAQTRGVVVESILGPLWQRRIMGFYALGQAAGQETEDREQGTVEPRLAPGIGAYLSGDEGRP